MNPFAKAANLTLAATIAVTFVSSAGATPLGAGSLPMKDAVAPTFETVQWLGWGGWRGGWGGWRGGWGGWGWGGGLGFAPAVTGLFIGSALASAPYYGGYYSPYYDSGYYYPPANYGYYAPAYYGSYGYGPYGLYDYAPSRHDGRRSPVRHH